MSTEVCGNALTIWSFGQTNTVAPLDSTTTTTIETQTFTPKSFGGRTKMYRITFGSDVYCVLNTIFKALHNYTMKAISTRSSTNVALLGDA